MVELNTRWPKRRPSKDEQKLHKTKYMSWPTILGGQYFNDMAAIAYRKHDNAYGWAEGRIFTRKEADQRLYWMLTFEGREYEWNTMPDWLLWGGWFAKTVYVHQRLWGWVPWMYNTWKGPKDE